MNPTSLKLGHVVMTDECWLGGLGHGLRAIGSLKQVCSFSKNGRTTATCESPLFRELVENEQIPCYELRVQHGDGCLTMTAMEFPAAPQPEEAEAQTEESAA